jgi:hypothetical protein
MCAVTTTESRSPDFRAPTPPMCAVTTTEGQLDRFQGPGRPFGRQMCAESTNPPRNRTKPRVRPPVVLQAHIRAPPLRGPPRCAAAQPRGGYAPVRVGLAGHELVRDGTRPGAWQVGRGAATHAASQGSKSVGEPSSHTASTVLTPAEARGGSLADSIWATSHRAALRQRAHVTWSEHAYFDRSAVITTARVPASAGGSCASAGEANTVTNRASCPRFAKKEQMGPVGPPVHPG